MYRLFYPLVLVVFSTCGCAVFTDRVGFDPLRGAGQGSAYAHHISGIIHEHNAELDRATEAYSAVIQYDKKAVTPRLRLIRTYLRLGNDEEALAACQKALEQIPDSPEIWLALGELQHSRGNMDAAVEAFKQAIALQPDSLAGYGALVELQEETNDLVAVIEIYEQLLKRSPDSAALHYQLGLNLSRIGDHAGAKRAFEKVLELEPRVGRVRFLLAVVLYEQEDFKACEEQLRLYLRERPEDTSALEYRAGCLFHLGRIGEAADLFERLVLQEDASASNYLQFAWVLLQTGALEEAQRNALEGEAYFFADLLFALSFFETPEEGAWPTNPWDDRYTLDEIETETDLILGVLPDFFGKEETCNTLTNKLEVLRENIGFSPILEFFCARILAHNGQHGEALAILDALRARGVNSKYIHYHSAYVSDKLNNFSDTEYHLRAYLEIEPDDADVLNFLGFFYAEHDRKLEEAETLLKRALAIDPENPYYLDSLGWVYYRQGKGEEALGLIQQALHAMESDDAELRDHLGDIHQLLGNTQRALAEWHHALRLDPSMEAVREKINAHQPKGE